MATSDNEDGNQLEKQKQEEFKKLNKTTQHIPQTMVYFDKDLEQIIDAVDNIVLKYIKTHVYTNDIPQTKNSQLAKILKQSRANLLQHQ